MSQEFDAIATRMRLPAGDTTVECLMAGEGPPLVLIHGDFQDAATWRWVLPDLAATHRVYAPTLPGFGRDAPPPSGLSAALIAGRLEALLAELGLDRPVVIGHSFGGLVALHLALRAGHRLGGLGLIASAGLGRAIHPLFLLESLPGAGELLSLWSHTPIGAVQRVNALAHLSFSDVARVPQGWFDDSFRLMLREGFPEACLAVDRAQVAWFGQRDVLLDRLRALDLPVLVVWGGRDRIVPPLHGRLAAERLRRGRLVTLPNCGHFPHVEQPEAFVACLREHLLATTAPLPDERRPS